MWSLDISRTTGPVVLISCGPAFISLSHDKNSSVLRCEQNIGELTGRWSNYIQQNIGELTGRWSNYITRNRLRSLQSSFLLHFWVFQCSAHPAVCLSSNHVGHAIVASPSLCPGRPRSVPSSIALVVAARVPPCGLKQQVHVSSIIPVVCSPNLLYLILIKQFWLNFWSPYVTPLRIQIRSSGAQEIELNFTMICRINWI
jgi:hypothetical protein